MNLKEFFKPTISKIIVFVILFVIFAPFIYYDTGIRCIMDPCPAGAIGSLLMYFLFSYNLQIYINGVLYINLIIGLIISYLFSCALISLIKKFRKNN